MTEEGTTQDPATIEILWSYDQLDQGGFVEKLVSVTEDQNLNEMDKLGKYAEAIAGFNYYNELRLFQIENTINSPKVSIQTLPHHGGHDHELISTIQPVAWILDGPAGYYNPPRDEILKNSVDHWEGHSHTLEEHLKKSITSNCFVMYHSIVILAIFLALIAYFTLDLEKIDPSYRSRIRIITLILMIGIAVGYDVVAVLFVLITETYFPDVGEPIEANLVQKQVVASNINMLSELVRSLPQNISDSIIAGNKKMSVSEIAGQFIIKYFYEPALELLNQLLSSKGYYNTAKAQTIGYSEIERCLMVYRFVREISDSLIPDISEKKLEKTQRGYMKRLIEKSIEEGIYQVHQQFLRLLYKSILDPHVRGQKLRAESRDLSLNHIIGSAETEGIINTLRKNIKKKKTASQERIPNFDQMRANITQIVSPPQFTSLSSSFSFSKI